ncbi:hypothetical protein ABZ806_13790 [Spirillospora sp. NPDC047418]
MHPPPGAWRTGLLGTVAVALVSGVLPLWFGLPRWLDGPQRDAEREVRGTMTAGLEAAARAGRLDAHAALRAARASNTRLLRFADGGDGTRVDEPHVGIARQDQ